MKKTIYIFVLIAYLLSGCDYLDVVPENDIETIETIFEERENAEKWLKTCHLEIIKRITSVKECPAFVGADEVVAIDYGRYISRAENNHELGFLIGDGLQSTLKPYGDVWSSDSFYGSIRYCNIFLENIGRVYNLLDGELELWTAEAKALKAHYYFELLRRYGPFILSDEVVPVTAETETMRLPRSPIDDCVKAIVDLLDEAIKDLPSTKVKDRKRIAYHNKESAATIKALTLLYAASPLFNGNTMLANFKNKNGVNLFPPYDKEKWKIAAEAADEAIRLCESAGLQLTAGNSNLPSKLLNTMKDIENTTLAYNFVNKEAILMFVEQVYLHYWYPYTLPRFRDNQEGIYLDRTLNGVYGPSLKIVEMYYTDHGLPLEEDRQWMPEKYTLGRETDDRYKNVIPLNSPTVLSLHLRREPRFYAHIAADRTLWYRNQFKKEEAYEATRVDAYQPELFGSHYTYYNDQAPQNPTGYWIKKHSDSEVPFRDYTTGVSYKGEAPVIIFRLAELYLASSEAWNEYLDKPDQRVYEPLNKIRKRAGILNVQDAWSAYAKNPDKILTQKGMRDVIRQEWNIEFMFEGRRFYNLRRWMTAHEELNEAQYGWNILGRDAQSFYNNFEGPIPVWKRRKFISPRDYFFPIRSEEIMVSGCVQNPGW